MRLAGRVRAEPGTGADAQQPPLFRRPGSWARLTAAVRWQIIIMKKIGWGLIISGFLIGLFGFLGSNTANVPWMLRIMSPTYYQAKAGVAKLDKEKTLEKGDRGFKEIEAIFRLQSQKEGHPEFSKIPLSKILRGDGGIGFSDRGANKYIDVHFILSDGRKIKWNLIEVKQNLEGLKSESIFAWSFGIFLIGGIISFAGAVLQNKQQKSNN